VLKNTNNIVDKLSLKGKVVVMTGGARGLGYEMLRGYCQAGIAAAGILDIIQENGEVAVKQLNKDYPEVKVVFHKVDVRDEKAVATAIDAIAKEFGRLDVCVANAGIAECVAAEEYPAERFRRVIDINLNGTFFTAQAAAKHMIAQGGGGSIIAIASISSHVANTPQPQSAYNASKAGIRQLCKNLAVEWVKHGIRVNTISPGYMDTILNVGFEVSHVWLERTPMGRMGNLDELNGIAVYLASDASTYTTGSDFLIDGGYTAW